MVRVRRGWIDGKRTGEHFAKPRGDDAWISPVLGIAGPPCGAQQRAAIDQHLVPASASGDNPTMMASAVHTCGSFATQVAPVGLAATSCATRTVTVSMLSGNGGSAFSSADFAMIRSA
jgi:hypothetical protein